MPVRSTDCANRIIKPKMAPTTWHDGLATFVALPLRHAAQARLAHDAKRQREAP
jgi:hypothetical protein